MDLARSKRLIKRALRAVGLELRRSRAAQPIGQDPFHDIRQRVGKDAVVFDVGANVGQTIDRFMGIMEDATIHAFEPGPVTFSKLQRAFGGFRNVYLTHSAVGSYSGSIMLHENMSSDMSSVLEPGPDSWGSIYRVTETPIITVDDYCLRNGITKIDVLKSDTQGFELDVLRGSEAMLSGGKVHLVLLELIFSDMYKNLPRPDEILRHLADRGYSLVSFYPMAYQHERAAWMDALFINANS